MQSKQTSLVYALSLAAMLAAMALSWWCELGFGVHMLAIDVAYVDNDPTNPDYSYSPWRDAGGGMETRNFSNQDRWVKISTTQYRNSRYRDSIARVQGTSVHFRPELYVTILMSVFILVGTHAIGFTLWNRIKPAH